MFWLVSTWLSATNQSPSVSHVPSLPPTGGEGAADFGPGCHRASEGYGRRGVSERGGGGERHLQPVQQPAGNRVCTA